MGLDIYVGSLPRYHLGSWQTVVQQYGKKAGIKVDVIRHNGIRNPVLESETIRTMVKTWKNNIVEDINRPLQWAESDETIFHR